MVIFRVKLPDLDESYLSCINAKSPGASGSRGQAGNEIPQLLLTFVICKTLVD
jgi:hypothetical protein